MRGKRMDRPTFSKSRDNPAKITLAVRVTPELKKELATIAAAEGVTLSRATGELLQWAIAHYRKK